MRQVYYGFMPGTSDTASAPVSSLALALVPPGNVESALSELRRGPWALGVPSARAYFDAPVLAWLSSVPGGDTLSRLARDHGLRFELAGYAYSGRDAFLAFSPDAALAARAAIGELRALGQLAAAGSGTDSPGYVPGPFAAGLGCYLATLPGPSEAAEDLARSLGSDGQPPSFRAKTCLLSLVRLEWTPGDASSSAWETLGAARVASIRARRDTI